jgi:diacylglycerol kinase family enzyme
VYWTILAKATAGGFTIRSRWKRHHEQLKACAERAKANLQKPGAAPSRIALEQGSGQGLVLTKERGYAKKIVQALIEEAASAQNKGREQPFYLIITAGGDGTSLEVLSALFHIPQKLRPCFAVLRLPMGTGNDGADAWELGEALNRIIGPSELVYQRALRLITSTPEKGPFLAFNILSVGLDAFVTHMTNKMKGKVPGDFYKLWVDIAALLYDRLYKVGSLDVRALDESNKEVRSLHEKILLLAVGASGRRSYGAGKHILPDERNVCAMKQMPLLRKIALKGLFNTGSHINKPESILFNASRVEISGKYPILAQMDGETVLLQPEDYPIAIELTAPIIPILQKP